MRSIFGLVALDEGSVRWRGEAITPAARNRFGYMPEERGLYPRMRVRDQLVYLAVLSGRSRPDAGRSVDGWLERFELAARAKDRLDTLSHGNQQRVQLIAALVNDPELLVLDEPFSGLDPLAMANMSGVLAERAAQGAAVLFSSHQLDLVEDLCEDVVIVDRGKVVLSGDLARLRAGIRQRFVEVRHTGATPPLIGIAGASVVERRDGLIRLRLADDCDIAVVAALAQSTGRLVSFRYEPPTLSQLFRQAVGS